MHDKDNGITRPAFPLGKLMAGELHDNAEAKAFTPVSVESSRLQQTNQDMLEGRHLFTSGISAASEPAFLDFGNHSNLYGKDNLIAQDLRLPTMPTPVPSLEQLGITKESTVIAAEAAKQLFATWTSEHPIAGMEADLMKATTGTNPHAWEDAAAAFPQLQGISVDIIKAYTLNEIHNYDRNDWIDDLAAANGKLIDLPMRKAEDATLGLSQISPKGVHTFEDRYPQLRKFLEGKGYSGPGHEAKALLDPECVAMIVAAKTASVVEDMQKHGIKHPTNEQLAYAYNPDVYSYSDHGHKEYKALYQGEIYASKLQHWDQQKEYYANNADVIAASKHIKNVLQCMQEL